MFYLILIISLPDCIFEERKICATATAIATATATATAIAIATATATQQRSLWTAGSRGVVPWWPPSPEEVGAQRLLY